MAACVSPNYISKTPNGPITRDGSVIPKFGKKFGNGNGNGNYRKAVEPKKFGKIVSKFLLKDSSKNGKYLSNFR